MRRQRRRHVWHMAVWCDRAMFKWVNVCDCGVCIFWYSSAIDLKMFAKRNKRRARFFQHRRYMCHDVMCWARCLMEDGTLYHAPLSPQHLIKWQAAGQHICLHTFVLVRRSHCDHRTVLCIYVQIHRDQINEQVKGMRGEWGGITRV